VKTFAFSILSIVILSVSVLVSNVYVNTVQLASAGNPINGIKVTTVGGIISDDTVWIKADSPYNLIGNILVDEGVTLTIQPGVTVNLNGYYIMINGTLAAIGNSNDEISFNGGRIIFTQGSKGWNQQTQSGSTIQYAFINGFFDTGGAIHIDGASPAILNNRINVTISITGGSPIISGNTLTGVRYATFSGGNRYLSEGIIINYDSSSPGSAIITENIIRGGFDHACISIVEGNPIIRRNLFSDGTIGIDLTYLSSSSNPTIENNTIFSCFRGISIGTNVALIFRYNNLYEISNYTIYSWHTKLSFNATYNWWGTTDITIINQKIYDFEDDFNLGKVNYNPFLTEPNSEAIPKGLSVPSDLLQPDLSSPSTTPTPDSSASPTQSPIASSNELNNVLGFDWVDITIISLLAVITVLLVVNLLYMRRRRAKQTTMAV